MGASRGGRTQWGAIAQLASLHLPHVTPFIRAESFVADIDDAHPVWLYTGGLSVDLSARFLLFKAEYAGRRANGQDAGEIRAAVVGWF